VQGTIDDVIVDLRPHSPTFLRHYWVTLSSERIEAIFVPPGFAHGFLTGTDGTRVLYEMSDYHAPELARGLRWNDPLLSIAEIAGIEHIHPRDAEYPDARLPDFEVFRSS
jgi:dTDP-4-dehydrorhamnose 3,5-epimerase